MQLSFYITLATLLALTSAYDDVQPQQVHLSLGVDPTEMVVTWVTMDKCAQATVQYSEQGGQGFLDQSAVGTSTTFTDGGAEQRTIQIHRVTIKGLTPGSTYLYHAGSTDGWSELFEFVAMKDGSNWSPRFAVYGDLGNINGQSISRLQQEVINRKFDAILHVGDFAYDMDSDNGRVGDMFMRQIEPIAAYVPYQTSVGNHENAYNFSNYVNRFSMINQADGSLNNHFYSFNIGPAHIISFSTEFYFFIEYGWTQIAEQYAWLEADLKEANKPENRAKHPWIITMGHRPMYCSTDDTDDCRRKESIIRTGIPIIHAYGLEKLFYDNHVDLEFWAHEHLYERMWPLYDRKVYNGTEAPYTNPTAPVHVIVGSAGCQEDLDKFIPDPADWSAVRISDYGYTHMNIINSTHLYLEQISDDQGGKVVDSLTLIKTNGHGAYPKRNWSG